MSAAGVAVKWGMHSLHKIVIHLRKNPLFTAWNYHIGTYDFYLDIWDVAVELVGKAEEKSPKSPLAADEETGSLPGLLSNISSIKLFDCCCDLDGVDGAGESLGGGYEKKKNS